MGKEIERKYLVTSRSFKKNASYVQEIRQGYLSIDEQKVVRLRTLDDKGFITIKSKVTDFTRNEFEYEIPKDEAIEMMQTLCPGLLEKTRYVVSFEGMKWEVDEFFNENQGLILAEIELESENQSFEKPSWLGKEVTQDYRYYNAYLSRHPFRKWGSGY